MRARGDQDHRETTRLTTTDTPDDRDAEPEHLHLAVVDQMTDRFERDRRRPDQDQHPLDRRGQVLDLLVSVAMAIVRRLARLAHGEERAARGVHSMLDWSASIVAFFSVRKADEPADESHRYGHEKIENLAAAIEGILILVGSVAIAFEAIRHLISHTSFHPSALASRSPRSRSWSTRRLRCSCAQCPAAPTRRRSRATPRICAPTRLPPGRCSWPAHPRQGHRRAMA